MDQQKSISIFGTSFTRINKALDSLRCGGGVIVVDDENRENEGDLIFPAQSITHEQMARLIRDCSGIVCLCITEQRCRQLELEMMTSKNTSRYGTAFTVSIEAADGVSTGVSAQDRITTIKKAIEDNAVPKDLASPGHVFPLVAKNGGVAEREGHTEATVELMQLAGLKPFGVLCELTNHDGTMMRLPEIIDYALENGFTVISIEDIKEYCRVAH